MEYLPKYFQKLTVFHTYLMKGFQRKWLFEGSPNKGTKCHAYKLNFLHISTLECWKYFFLVFHDTLNLLCNQSLFWGKVVVGETSRGSR